LTTPGVSDDLKGIVTVNENLQKITNY